LWCACRRCVCVRACVQDVDVLWLACGCSMCVAALPLERVRCLGLVTGHAMDVRPADCRELCERRAKKCECVVLC
jgi:hypothetical protein